VICTYQFLQNRHRAFEQTKHFFEYAEEKWLKFAMKHFKKPKQIKNRTTSGLYSDIYKVLNLPIRHVILDEAQYVKNHEGLTHKAIKSLYYDRIFMLTGTFLHNRWHDIFGLLDLLPGHPFTTRAQFLRCFAENGDIRNSPSASKKNRLIKFLQAIVVSRPSSLLQLGKCSYHQCLYALAWDTVIDVVFFADKFLQALRIRNVTELQKDSRKILWALVNAIRAQQCGSNRLLLDDKLFENFGGQEPVSKQGQQLLESFEGDINSNVAAFAVHLGKRNRKANIGHETGKLNLR
jgi:hypothetical protein